MPIDLSVIAPRGSTGQRPATPAPVPPSINTVGAQPAGVQPGQMEAFKAAIQALQRQGLSNEEILDILLKIAEKMGLNVPEDQLRSLVESVQPAQPGGTSPTMGTLPTMGGMPPTT